jgi:hypothetical protein
MRPGIYYLPEHHAFEHVGIAPWPHIYANYQQDWIDAVTTLESWLNQYVGAHYSEWAYSQQRDMEYWHACVAFRQAKCKTLFLLQWTWNI